MAAVVRIAVEIDQQGVVRGFQQITAEGKKIETGLQKAGSTGNVVLTKMAGDTAKVTRGMQQSNAAVNLLSQTLGIQVPRALEGVISRSALGQKAIAAAFNITVAAAFAQIVATVVVDAIQKAIEHLNKFEDELGRITESNAGKGTQIIVDSLKRQREARIDSEMAAADEVGKIFVQSRARIAEAEDRRRLAVAAGDVIAARNLTAEIEQIRFDAEQAGIRARAGLRKKESEERRQRDLQAEAELQQERARQGEQLERETIARGEAQIREMERQKQAEKDRVALLGGLEEDLRIMRARTAGDAVAEILIEEQRRVRETEARLRELGATEQEIARARVAIHGQAMEQIAQAEQRRAEEAKQKAEEMRREWEQAVGRMADELEQFVDSPLEFIKRKWKRAIFEMVAAWLVGVRQMQGATSASRPDASGLGSGLGGILGGILGGGFGLPGVFGGIGTPPFNPGAPAPGAGGGPEGSGSNFLPGGFLSGTPLSAGQGFLPGGQGQGPSGTRPPDVNVLSALFGRKPLGQLIGAAGLAIAIGGVRGGSPLRGALGGALAGGQIGFTFGGPLGAVVGAIIGGIVGLIGGIFGRGRKRRQRDEIERQAFQQIKLVEDVYNSNHMDYLSARTQLEQIREQVNQAMRQLRWPSRMNPHIDAAINRINATEQERQRRLGLTVSPRIFERGGYIGAPVGMAAGPGTTFGPLRLPRPEASGSPRFQDGGAVGIIAHRGEFVVNARATARNRSTLERINSGGMSAGGGVTVQVIVNALDSRSVRDWLRNGGAEEIMAGVRQAQREGA